MASTWPEMSEECLRSANKLMQERLYRRSVSSAYYAAYCAVTAELVVKGVSFAHGWQNPAHDQLPDFIMNRLTLPRETKYEIRKTIVFLRGSRENADYRPNSPIERHHALEAIILAQKIIKRLEERYGRTR